jgi:nifR3 family TIM-barrel protein
MSHDKSKAMNNEIAEFKIGNNVISPGLILAPMSGVTNSCFRRLIKRRNPGAVGLVVTEFISIEGLVRENQQSHRMMDFAEEELPISIQIFGRDIDHLVEAALMAEARGANIVDINCGCPVPKVVKKGGGCELMRQPEHLEKMLSAVAKALKVPLTLKIRAGWDDSSRNAVEIAKLAEGAGVQMLAVHGRTRTEMYRGLADWKIIRDVANSIKIPVVGSGDIVDGQSAKRAFEYGISGLMVGRAALVDPWVFSKIRTELSGGMYERPSDLETVEIIKEYLELLLVNMPPKAVLGRLKQLVSQVTRRVRGSSQARKNLCGSGNLEQFVEQLENWRMYLEVSQYNNKIDNFQIIEETTSDLINLA